MNIYSLKSIFITLSLSQRRRWTFIMKSAHLDECGGKYLLSSLDGFYLNADISRALNSINNSLFILEGRKTEERERTVEGYVRLNSAVEYDFIENTEKYPQMENPQAVLEYVDMFF